MIKINDIRYRSDNPAAYDCFRHPHVDGKYTLSVFTNKETGFPALGDPRIDNAEDSIWAFEDVMNEHAQIFAEETGMDISYSSKNERFELSGLEFKYSFADQAEADGYAEKVYRFDAECGEILADFRQQMHEAYEPDLECHLRDRYGFFSARGIKRQDVFEGFGHETDSSDPKKSAAMKSVADRFHEQHPDYEMGVYPSPCDSVLLFTTGFDGKPMPLGDTKHLTKKYVASLPPENRKAHIQLLKDFDRASDDFIYAAATGIDRGLDDDFTKAVESLNDNKLKQFDEL